LTGNSDTSLREGAGKPWNGREGMMICVPIRSFRRPRRSQLVAANNADACGREQREQAVAGR